MTEELDELRLKANELVDEKVGRVALRKHFHDMIPYVKEYERVEGEIDEGGSITDSNEIGYYVACEIDARTHQEGYFYVLVLTKEQFDSLPKEIRDEVL